MAKMSIPNELMKKINTCTRHIRNEIAKQITEDLREEYRTVIADFYRDYKPHRYLRTYSSYFATNIYKFGGNYKKITTFASDSFTTKFKVGSEFIGEPYRASADYVFSRTFELGIHGWIPLTVKNIAKGMVNPELVNNKIFNGTQPNPPLTPTPKQRMDEWFDNYKVEANLGSICRPIVARNFKKFF